MKTFQLIALIAFVSFVSLSSCSKKSDDITPTGQTQVQAGFNVKIDGQVYAPDFSYALAAFPGANDHEKNGHD